MAINSNGKTGQGNTWRMLLVIAGVVLAGGILFAWSRVLFPVLVAFLAAYITHPLASFFEKHRLPRILGFLAVLLVFIGFLSLLSFVFLPAIVHELMLIGKKIPAWREVIEKHVGYWLVDLEGRYPDAYALLQERISQWAQENLPSIAQRLVGWLAGIIGSAVGIVSTLLSLVLIPVLTAYLTVDFRKFMNALQILVPRPVLPEVKKVVREVDQVLKDFLRGQLLVAMALGVMYTAGLLLVRAPLALVIGPLAGLFSLVPYLGFVLGFGTASLLTFLEYQDLWHLTGVLVTFTVAQSVDGWFLTPRLLGKRVGLHPVWILVALLLGGELFGLAGMVVAVPVAAALRVVVQHSVQAYRGSLLYVGLNPEPIFYTREGSSFCKEFELLLQPLLDRRGICFRRVDIDSSPPLKKQFSSRVPLLEVNGKVVAEGRVSAIELEKRLKEALDSKNAS